MLKYFAFTAYELILYTLKYFTIYGKLITYIRLNNSLYNVTIFNITGEWPQQTK